MTTPVQPTPQEAARQAFRNPWVWLAIFVGIIAISLFKIDSNPNRLLALAAPVTAPSQQDFNSEILIASPYGGVARSGFNLLAFYKVATSTNPSSSATWTLPAEGTIILRLNGQDPLTQQPATTSFEFRRTTSEETGQPALVLSRLAENNYLYSVYEIGVFLYAVMPTARSFMTVPPAAKASN